MAALLEAENPSAGVTAPPPDALSAALYGDAAQPLSAASLAQQGTTGKALMASMPDLVKGAGFGAPGRQHAAHRPDRHHSPAPPRRPSTSAPRPGRGFNAQVRGRQVHEPRRS